MSNTANIALTALQAFDRKCEVIAEHIVNINTDRFKKSRAELVDASPFGVRVTIERVNTPKDTVTIGEAERAHSSVNLAEELIALIVNRQNDTANIKTAKTADEMREILLDILK